jgi:hypothetical protein
LDARTSDTPTYTQAAKGSSVRMGDAASARYSAAACVEGSDVAGYR